MTASKDADNSGPFEYLKSIQKSKIDMIRGSDNPELAAKGYNPWLTNKALSFHVDSILYANEMNLNYQMDSPMQYGYLINTVRAMNRKWTWLKSASDADIETIQDHYKINKTRAIEVLEIIGHDAVDAIKKSKITGGATKKK